MLENEGLKYSPDLVLLVWHSTDIENNLAAGLYTLENGNLVRRKKEYLPAVRIRERLERIPTYRWLEGNSQLYTFVREKAAGWAQAALQLRGGWKSNREATEQEIHDRTQLAVALLQAILDRSTAAGAPLLVLDVPCRRSRTDFEPSFPWGPDGDSHGLRVISPIARFEEHRGQLLSWERSHGHFTPLGCRVVGRVLADAIVEQRLLVPGTRSNVVPAGGDPR